MYDYIIIGAGLAGGVIARKLAEKNNKILIVERREHLAGNTYDCLNEHGIRIQKYGPHVFHTNSDEVYQFITQFCIPIEYKTKCEAVIDGFCTTVPFNFKTIDQFYSPAGAELLKKEISDLYQGRDSVSILEMLEAHQISVRNFANFLFEKDYRPYTAKQWGISPSEIDSSVLKRVPITLSYNDTYFQDKYEFIPKDGFTSLYKSLIDHSNIDVKLKEDALKHIKFDLENHRILFDNEDVEIVYTGAIDELFNYEFGLLPYRSLRFDFKSIETTNFQNVAIVAYPQAEGYTRITEYTKMPFQDGNGWTCVAYEYPTNYCNKNGIAETNEPYYPILTEESKATYEKYRDYSKEFQNLTLVGRLAEFKYYNMDQVILSALEVADKLDKKLQKFSFRELDLKGSYIIKPFYAQDERGGLIKDYNIDIFMQAGINYELKETFYTLNKRGVIRAIHFQLEKPQPKLMRCISGRVYYVMVDLRPESETFGQWRHFILSGDNPTCILAPTGFGQGYLVLEDAIMSYKASEVFYGPGDSGIMYNDLDINIDWPYDLIGGRKNLIISEKDIQLMSFKEYKKALKQSRNH